MFRKTLILWLVALAMVAAKCDDESSGPKEIFDCGEEFTDACEEAVETCLEEVGIDDYFPQTCGDGEYDYCLCLLDEGFTNDYCEDCLDDT